MKFSMNSTALADAITAGSSSLPARPLTAILGGVLIEAQLGAIALSSFNYDRATSRVAAADVADTDTAVVSGRLLHTIAGNLPKNVDCHVTATDSGMVIAAGRTEYRLPLMHAHDYPNLPALTGQPIGSVSVDDFSDAVRIIGALASTDAQPANLTALNIACQPGTITLCATDRYIIGRQQLSWAGRADTVINVAAADLLATIKAISGSGVEAVEILWDGAMLGLRTPSTTIITRTLAEEFPDIDRVLAVDSYHAAVTVPTGQLITMLKRAASIADDQLAQVDITVEADTLSVTTTQSSTGNIVDSTTAIHHGGDRRLALSSFRLHKALSVIDNPDVTLAFRKSGHLVSIYPGTIDDSLQPPQTSTVAALMGIQGKR